MLIRKFLIKKSILNILLKKNISWRDINDFLNYTFTIFWTYLFLET